MDNNKKSLEELLQLKASGDKEAALTAGIFYMTGFGCEEEPDTAFSLWESIAEDSDEAKLYTANCLLLGIGTAKDAPRAVKMYEELSENPYAVYNLGLCIEEGRVGSLTGDALKEALNYYLKSYALTGKEKIEVAEIFCKLGECFLRGTGRAKSLTQAEKMLLRAESLGSARAAIFLGMYYAETDVKKSAAYYYDSGELDESGLTPFQYLINRSGLSWGRRLYRTIEQYGRMSDDTSAKIQLANIFLQKENYAKAAPLLKSLADEGVNEAQFLFAKFLERGEGRRLYPDIDANAYLELARKGNNLRSLMYYADKLIKSGGARSKEVLEVYEQAFQLGNTKAGRIAAAEYFLSGDYVSALRLCRIIESDVSYIVRAFCCARGILGAENEHEALRRLYDVLPEAVLLDAYLIAQKERYNAAKKYADAKKLLERSIRPKKSDYAIGQWPDNFELMYYLCNLYWETEDWEKAEELAADMNRQLRQKGSKTAARQMGSYSTEEEQIGKIFADYVYKVVFDNIDIREELELRYAMNKLVKLNDGKGYAAGTAAIIEKNILEKLAKSGDMSAAFFLGHILVLDKDFIKAEIFFDICKHKIPLAYYILDYISFAKRNEQKLYEEKIISRLVKAKSPVADFMKDFCASAFGYGVLERYEKYYVSAFYELLEYWFMLYTHVPLLRKGIDYVPQGLPVEKNYNMDIYTTVVSSAYDDADALCKLGHMLAEKGNETAAADIYKEAMLAGSLAAKLKLCEHYIKTNMNTEKAVEMLEEMTEDGIAGAFILLGDLYKKGYGVERNEDAYRRCSINAAALGYAAQI